MHRESPNPANIGILYLVAWKQIAAEPLVLRVAEGQGLDRLTVEHSPRSGQGDQEEYPK